MIFTVDIAAALSRVLRDKKNAMIGVYLGMVRDGKRLEREAAAVTARAVLNYTDSYTIESVCDVLGWIELSPILKVEFEAKRAMDAEAEKIRLEVEAEKFAQRQAKLNKKAQADAEREQRGIARAKANEIKAEAQRKQNESRKNKTVFTVKGTNVDDITTIIPVVSTWLANQESVYLSGGVLARWRDSKEGMQTVTPDNLGSLLGLGFSFRIKKFSPLGEEIDEFMSQCPQDIRTAILGTEYFQDIREVDAVLDRPVVLADGTVTGTKPGYDKKTRFLFYRAEQIEEVSLEEAYKAIYDVFSEFPEQAIPGALALIFTELMRPCLPTAPMIFVNAPTPGSGKSLMARCCLSIVNSVKISALTQPDKEDEFDKQVKGQIEKYPGKTIFFDDFEGIIEYQILKTVMTEPDSIEFRILGTNRLFKAKTNFSVVMTGNNAWLTEELERRSIKVEIDTGLEHPTMRNTKRNSDQLRNHIEENRSHLRACAIKMLVDGLVNATEKHTTRVMGSFETWAETVAKSVVFCVEKLKEQGRLSADVAGDVTPDMQEYASRLDMTGEVLSILYERGREKTWRISELEGESKARLDDLLGTKADHHSNQTRFSRLRKYAGRPRSFGSATYRLDQLREQRWRVVVVDGTVMPEDPEAMQLDYHLDAKNLTTDYN